MQEFTPGGIWVLLQRLRKARISVLNRNEVVKNEFVKNEINQTPQIFQNQLTQDLSF